MKPVNIQVRFADLDILGHVNNTVYFSYLETTRVHYFRELLGRDWDWRKFGIVLVKNEMEYKKSVLLTHDPVIYMYATHIGEKSFVLEYHLYVNDEIYGIGHSTQVSFDASTQKTIPIPHEMRKALESIKKDQN